MRLLYGKPFAEKIQRTLARTIIKEGIKPKLAIVCVGNNRASLDYIKRKCIVGDKVKCTTVLYHLKANTSTKQVIALLDKLNKDNTVHGIIVQLPLPAKYITDNIIAAITPHKDVDHLRHDSSFTAPSVQAIWHLLRIITKIKKDTPILILGYGRLIGKPLHLFLQKRHFTHITIADQKTKHISALCKKAEVIISGTGHPHLIKRVKKGAVVIDAGSGWCDGKIRGDVDPVSIAKYAAAITPVPGGIGSLTVAYLFKNVVHNAIKKQRDIASTKN